MNTYDHLNIKVSKKFIKKIKLKYPPYEIPKKYTFLLSIIKFLSKFHLMKRLAGQVINFNNLEEESKRTKELINKLKSKTLEEANSFKSDFGYNEFEEINALIGYANQINTNFPQQSESKQLYEKIDHIYSEIIKKYDIKNFVNFGSLYSHVDYKLAKKFSNTNFICSDRSTLTKNINETIFGNIGNIKFIDGDIFDYLEKTRLDNSLFFTTRTLTLLPKEFILKLYKKLHQNNFKYISLMEQIGISRQTFTNFEFTENDRPSVAYRQSMYIHNYIGILKLCGYKILDSQLIKTDHPHDDFRILYILAEKA